MQLIKPFPNSQSSKCSLFSTESSLSQFNSCIKGCFKIVDYYLTYRLLSPDTETYFGFQINLLIFVGDILQTNAAVMTF